jgi:hypothetical protein
MDYKTETLMDGLQTINTERQTRDTLIPSRIRRQLVKNRTGHDVNNPFSIGPALINYDADKQTREEMFSQNYIDPSVAESEKRLIENHMKDLFEEDKVSSFEFYPPLFIRYDDQQTGQDAVIPVKILKGGVIERTTTKPDFIILFSAFTKTVLIKPPDKESIDRDRLVDMKIAITALYSMVSSDDNPVTISQFTQIYDRQRYHVLRLLQTRV